MALTIKQQPGISSSNKYVHESGYPTYYCIYDPLYYTYADFKYGFSIYTTQGLLNKSITYPHIANGAGFLSLNQILKTQFYPDFNPTVTNTQFAACPGSIINYRVVGESYYSGQSQTTVNFNKVIAINANYDSFNLDDYVLKTNKNKALTKRDSVTPLKLEASQHATLRFLNGRLIYNSTSKNSFLYELFLTVYKVDGNVNLYTSYVNNPYWSANLNGISAVNTTLQDLKGVMVEAGVGPKNITNLYWNWISTGKGSKTISMGNALVKPTLTCGDVYKVEAYAWPYGTAGRTSQPYWYEVTCECKHTPIELAWKNELGGYDYFNFNKVSTKLIETNRDTFYKNRDKMNTTTYQISHTNYDRGETVNRIDMEDKYVVNTNLITKTEAQLLIDLWVSSDVYCFISAAWYPIIIEQGSVITNTTKHGLINYELSFRMSNKRNVNR